MKSLKYSLVVFCLPILFSSCKNDVKINAPYKEIPSIYAVLNPYENLQMIRVNKVFLGEGDANQMAKVEDSINYQPNEITVTLKHSSNKVILFNESMVTTTDGAFNSHQRVYVSNEKLFTTGVYTLTVKNNHTGNVFTAVASPIRCVDSTLGAPFPPPYYPYAPGVDPNGSGFINYAPPTGASTKTNVVFFRQVDNAKIYKLIIRSHFRDSLGTSSADDYVDYTVDNPTDIRKISDNNYINLTFTSSSFYAAIGFALSQKKLRDVLGRKMWLMEYIVYASTQEYVDYNEFIKPSLSFDQNKPIYSNFIDRAALGIFTFRSTLIVQKEPAPAFVNSYSTNPNTCKYKFYNTDNVVLGCN